MCQKKRNLIFAGFLGFDRTYEELKPCFDRRRQAVLLRFDRTYEELKLPRTSFHRTERWCRFDRTYEELKRQPFSAQSRLQMVLIVPMRN